MKPGVIDHSNLKYLYFPRKETSHDEEAVVQRCSVKNVFLEISQNSQENTCARVSFLIKLRASGLQLYLKRDPDTGVFLRILQNF